MLKREERATYDNTSFFNMLKINGISSLTFKNFGFYCSIFTGALAYYIFEQTKKDTLITDIANYISNILPGVSASILGIIIAGLSIVVALTSGKIIHLLLKNKTLQNLLFPFWFAAALWALLLIFSMVLPLLIKLIPIYILKNFLIIILVVFIYTLYGTISLVGNTIRIMLILAQLSNDE